MLMTWKKAAAGEIIYNKCPPNASGKGRQLPLQTRAPPSLLPTSGPRPWVCIPRCAGSGERERARARARSLNADPCLISLQGLPAAAVSSVHRAWHIGDCPALLAASPMSTATCTCQ